jgi:DsbC/DsbD-like thiol-disulfide interchange protein
MKATSAACLAVLLSACSAPKEAPVTSESNVVQWAAVAGPLRPGPENSMLVDVDLQVTVIDGWHVYSLTQAGGGPTPLTVTVAPSPPYSVAGEIVGPPPVTAKDSNFGIETETYSGEQVFRIPVALAATSVVSPPDLEIKVRSQACSDRLCLPPRTTSLTVKPAPGST